MNAIQNEATISLSSYIENLDLRISTVDTVSQVNNYVYLLAKYFFPDLFFLEEIKISPNYKMHESFKGSLNVLLTLKLQICFLKMCIR